MLFRLSCMPINILTLSESLWDRVLSLNLTRFSLLFFDRDLPFSICLGCWTGTSFRIFLLDLNLRNRHRFLSSSILFLNMDYWSRSTPWSLTYGMGVIICGSSWSLTCGMGACTGLHLYCLSLCHLSFHNLGKLLPHLVQVCSTIVS